MSVHDRSRERGAVMVMVALWLPIMAIFASFAIDAGHFWDFSRNLQNRVDAAVLAAGNQFGGSCFGTPTAGELTSIGTAAQTYSGAPVGTPSPGGTAPNSSNGPNLPYQWDTAAPYQNQQQNPLGDPKNFFLVLNGSSSADKGGTNFSAGNFCSATYDGQTNPTVDAWLTQKNVPFFFNFLSVFGATISAHARVQLQGAGSTNSLPIAVPDPAQTPCLRAELINDQTGALIQDTNGNNIDVAMTPPNPGGTPPTVNWTVTLPTFKVPAAQLSLEAYIPDDCNNPGYPANGVLYDSKLVPPVTGTQVADHGLEFINTFTPLPAGDPATPQIGSVNLAPAKDCDNANEAAAQDPYFYFFPKSTACSVNVNADVKFPSALKGTEVDVSMDGGNPQKMTAPKAGSNTYTYSSFSIPSPDGANVGLPYRHTFTFTWKANGGNSGSFNGGNPLQATYAATSDGSDPADDSGPITQAFIGDTSGKIDVNSLQQTTNATLTVAFHLQGLDLAQPGDAPIVLRAAVQNRKATGAFNCWDSSQSGSAADLANAIINGCPKPVAVFDQSQGCVTLPTTPLTCGYLVPGNKRNQVTQAFQTRIESAVFNGKSSPCDAWQAYSQNGTAISGFEPWNTSVPDPRIMVMAVTAPADLAGHGGPNNLMRILGFATFYVTGYDGDQWLPTGTGKGKKKGQAIPNCSSPMDQDEAYPGDPTQAKDQIWGHFIKYAAAGTSNGQPCNVNDVSVCVPALTR